MKIAPSILASDLSDLASGLRQCESGGADLVHVDVMDGHFVPNLTFGPPVIAALAERTDLVLDVHLMVANPEALLEDYLSCGASWLSVHWEAAPHLDRLLGTVRMRGLRAGVALNPSTPVEVLIDLLPSLDYVVLMSVNPGFSGQKFIPYVLEKARRLRTMIDGSGHQVEIEMDGGIAAANLGRVQAAGVDVSVVGSGIFGQQEPAETLMELRRRGQEA